MAKRRISNFSKLHLGCGSNVLEGWANIDVTSSSNGAIFWDLTNPLPIRSRSVDFIFTEHFIEHLTRAATLNLFKESHRVLRNGGVLRCTTPDLRAVIDEYVAKRITEWSDDGWSPSTPCQMLNEAMRLWGHQFLYDIEELSDILRAAGFDIIETVCWHTSRYRELINLEIRPYHYDLIVEAVRQ
jgi:predicted SAM-dependent methyltransferase